MPSADTFSIPPIGRFVRRHLEGLTRTVDPFARNSRLCTHRNDLNPQTAAEWHLEAVEFLTEMGRKGERYDGAVLDPPYSPRQVSDCYASAGMRAGQKDTQNAVLYRSVRDAVLPLLLPGAVVLSFGWNSVGMGKNRGFRQVEILLVCHGGAHNDTICLAERLSP